MRMAYMLPKLVGVVGNCIWVYQGCVGWGREWNIWHAVQGCVTCRYHEVVHGASIHVYHHLLCQLIGMKWKPSPHLHHYIHITVEYWKLGGSSGIAAVPWARWLGFKSWQGKEFVLSTSRLALGPTQSPVDWVPAILSVGKVDWG